MLILFKNVGKLYYFRLNICQQEIRKWSMWFSHIRDWLVDNAPFREISISAQCGRFSPDNIILSIGLKLYCYKWSCLTVADLSIIALQDMHILCTLLFLLLSLFCPYNHSLKRTLCLFWFFLSNFKQKYRKRQKKRPFWHKYIAKSQGFLYRIL